jgi:DNA-directed RNA polymerase III subunit RPC8
VIHKVGLCLCFHSLVGSSEGLIGHGSGLVNVNVDFRMIVYRPFKGEILRATITHSHPGAGVYLSQDFFEDIVVPPEVLFENTMFEKDEQGIEAFIWRTRNAESGLEDEYYFDKAEAVLFRVEDEQWRDASPQPKNPGGQFITEHAMTPGEVKKTPYLIRGSMMHGGLGPTLWWVGEEYI